MKRPLPRFPVEASKRFATAMRQHLPFPGFFFALVFSIAVARSQDGWQEPVVTHSLSGQFTVTAAPQFSPLLHRADLATNADYVRLEPALLTVSAERFKRALWSQLGLKLASAWSGKIFFTLHPAGSPDEQVNINIGPLMKVWNYRVDFPDVVTRTRYARALAATLLLEIANRDNPDANHSAEIPPWLTDGLAEQVLGNEPLKIILSAPAKSFNGIPQIRLNRAETSFDPLDPARLTLQNFPALTFDELCWPTDAQMNGTDGGAYLASAQLFVVELLGLKDGAERIRALLAKLPACMNWQTAFYAAFHEDFKSPLDVEKWWSLRVIRFAARDPGPHWTADASRERLADLIAVPVEFRSDTNALPEHAVVSLQDTIRNFQSAQRTAILEIKLRDFELALFRLPPPFAGLADGYRSALADFLGENKNNFRPVVLNKNGAAMRVTTSVAETVKKLDALDASRRDVETKMDANPLRRNLNPTAP